MFSNKTKSSKVLKTHVSGQHSHSQPALTVPTSSAVLSNASDTFIFLSLLRMFSHLFHYSKQFNLVKILHVSAIFAFLVLKHLELSVEMMITDGRDEFVGSVTA